MDQPTSAAASHAESLRERLSHVVHHLEHVLPGQAPIRDFVHHNTLHGFQHLPFPQAVTEARKITGVHGYLPLEQFRTLFRQGRINLAELTDALIVTPDLECDAPLGPVTRGDVYRVALLTELAPLTAAQLLWRIEEMHALDGLQPDVAEPSRQRMHEKCPSQTEAEMVGELWQTCLEVLGLESVTHHAEDLFDLTPERARWLLSSISDEEETKGRQKTERKIRRLADTILKGLLNRVGRDLTLRGLLLTLTGEDLLEQHRPYLVRHLASFLDQGLSSWPLPQRQKGFYVAWKNSARNDLAPFIDNLPQWRAAIQKLPATAVEAVEQELSRLNLPEELWGGYLERLALELPGWSGMVMWRHLRPGYQGLAPMRVEVMDYLAVRLVLERLFAQRLCLKEWQIEPQLEALRTYFEQAQTELLGRWMLFNTPLPDYLSSRIQQLLTRWPEDVVGREQEWRVVASMLVAWRFSTGGERALSQSAQRHGWPLFVLAQHLGLSAQELRAGGSELARNLLEATARMDIDTASYVWLQAYERHYHEQILQALAVNHGRGRWADRTVVPKAQVIFCMDDREEGFRRHLEEHNPAVETLGVAGFFEVPINWRGLDDTKMTPLCPVVVVPAHNVHEEPGLGAERTYSTHNQRRAWRLRLQDLLFRRSHRGLLGAALLTTLAAPGALVVLLYKLLAPLKLGKIAASWHQTLEKTVPTRITLTAPADAPPATPKAPRIGFTDSEQADRVGGMLRNIGLTSGFAPLVVLMGHGSSSQNNPHLAAYDCGACSGRHGGPNARVFAAMANRPEIRGLLKQRGIHIPDNCWFLGAEHNTGSEDITWYDTDELPATQQAAFTQLKADLATAQAFSAQERSRRLASAPRRPDPHIALAHVVERTLDFSQARPELGHATNAVAVIGRRSVSQGVFFDRRMYLISYDPTQDPTGQIVEGILLAAGPVGAGISLEYYFSTVDNERFGCGTKIVHNLTGFLGVMEGTCSDLRTGLPRQMIEIHEAMRLLVIVEQRPEILSAIYQRQPILQELIGNAWILLAAKEPESGAIYLFRPSVGWVSWQLKPTAPPLPQVNDSPQWYLGQEGTLPPALVRQPEAIFPYNLRDSAYA